MTEEESPSDVEEQTATLTTYHTRVSNHETSWKNGISSTHLTQDEAERKAETHNQASYFSGEMTVNKSEETVYKGTLKVDSVRESSLRDEVIAHYEIHKSGYDAPATVHESEESDLSEEAWFVFKSGGFQRAERFGEIEQ